MKAENKKFRTIHLSLEAIGIIFHYVPTLAIIKIVLAMISGAGTSCSFWFMQRLVDAVSRKILNGGTIEYIISAGIGFLIAMLIPIICSSYVDGMIQIEMERKIGEKLSEDVIRKFMRIPYADFESMEFQDTLIQMSRSPDRMILKLFQNTIIAMRYFMILAGLTGIFLKAGVGIAVSFSVLFAPLIWLNFKTADMMNKIYNEQTIEQRKRDYLEQLLTEKDSLLELKIFGAVRFLEKKRKALVKEVLNRRIRVKVKAHNYYLIGNFLTFVWLCSILVFLCMSALEGSITLGVFAAVLTAMGEALDDSEALYMTLQKMRWGTNVVSHFLRFMRLEEEQDPSKSKEIKGDNCIRFENVSFTYPGSEHCILKNVSFEIKGGEHIALVGVNGAGKSTIIKLLCRLYRPQSGRIVVNGIDLQEFSQEQLQKLFSVVFQDYNRFYLTLRENVAAGALERKEDDESVRKALRMAGIENEKLLMELDLPLGKLEEQGIELSGGQWQRIAIARAYFTDSEFVILDEPTSALDPIAENAMYENIASILTQKSCIFISHRLASAKMADRILVLSKGQIQEEGSHAELMERGGIYADMYRMQSSWYENHGSERECDEENRKYI